MGENMGVATGGRLGITVGALLAISALVAACAGSTGTGGVSSPTAAGSTGTGGVSSPTAAGSTG
ncbi:MAG: collagen-like triple helix repeat-containing lipoprotein, partial [Chloroflexota bacterium]